MKNPKVAALVCFLTAAWLGYGLLTAREAPSATLLTMKVVFLIAALIGLFGALMQLAAAKTPPRE